MKKHHITLNGFLHLSNHQYLYIILLPSNKIDVMARHSAGKLLQIQNVDSALYRRPVGPAVNLN